MDRLKYYQSILRHLSKIQCQPVLKKTTTVSKCSRVITEKNKMLVILFGFILKIWLQRRHPKRNEPRISIFNNNYNQYGEGGTKTLRSQLNAFQRTQFLFDPHGPNTNLDPLEGTKTLTVATYSPSKKQSMCGVHPVSVSKSSVLPECHSIAYE